MTKGQKEACSGMETGAGGQAGEHSQQPGGQPHTAPGLRLRQASPQPPTTDQERGN